MNASTKALIPVVQLSDHEQEVQEPYRFVMLVVTVSHFVLYLLPMTKRLEFNQADIHYLANLCHNCGACLHACQYAPPHEFGVNIPKAMAQVRLETYQEFATPQPLGQLYKSVGIPFVSTLTLIFLFCMLAVVWWKGTDLFAGYQGNFYAIFPHNFLALLFGATFTVAIVYSALELANFGARRLKLFMAKLRNQSFVQATQNVLTLKYLDGGHGKGCNEQDDRYTQIRRVFHHLTFYGFMLCFAATGVATFISLFS